MIMMMMQKGPGKKVDAQPEDSKNPTVEDEALAKQVMRLIELLDDLEDVKSVHSNYDVDESLLES